MRGPARRARGFSLIEMMVAMSIASVILVGTTGAVMSINRIIADANRRTQVWDDAKRLEEFLIARAQGAGGGQLRPYHAVYLENPTNCRTITGLPACGTNDDRLTILQPQSGVAAITATGTTGGLTIDQTSGCPLTSSDYTNKQAVVIGANKLAASVFLMVPTTSSGACTITVAVGQATGLSSALASVTYPATVVVVDAETYFVDMTTHTLKVWSNDDNTNTADSTEFSTLDDQVYDLQVAAGYDGLPEDGDVVDNGNTTDEWLYNAASDPAIGAGTWATVRTDQLRMLEIGLAVGVPSTLRGGNSVTLLNGPARSTANVYLARTISKAYLRNLALFTQ